MIYIHYQVLPHASSVHHVYLVVYASRVQMKLWFIRRFQLRLILINRLLNASTMIQCSIKTNRFAYFGISDISVTMTTYTSPLFISTPLTTPPSEQVLEAWLTRARFPDRMPNDSIFLLLFLSVRTISSRSYRFIDTPIYAAAIVI